MRCLQLQCAGPGSVRWWCVSVSMCGRLALVRDLNCSSVMSLTRRAFNGVRMDAGQPSVETAMVSAQS